MSANPWASSDEGWVDRLFDLGRATTRPAGVSCWNFGGRTVEDGEVERLAFPPCILELRACRTFGATFDLGEHAGNGPDIDLYLGWSVSLGDRWSWFHLTEAGARRRVRAMVVRERTLLQEARNILSSTDLGRVVGRVREGASP